jgi:hypothetical protein
MDLSGTAPPVSVADRLIPVPIDHTMGVPEISNALSATLNADGEYSSVVTSGPLTPNNNIVLITNKFVGGRPDSNNGTTDLIVRIDVQGSDATIRPPAGISLLVWHTERLVASGITNTPDTIFFSQILDGGTWDQLNWSIRVGASDSDAITSITGWTNYNLLVLKQHSSWIVGCDPQIEPAAFQINRVHDRIGSMSPRTVCQVGTDIFFLSDSCQVHSIKNILASEQQKEVGPALSYPVQDILDRINRSAIETATAFHWRNRYILAVPLDAATNPNYVLVFNTLTNSWSGVWTGIKPLYFTSRLDGKTQKLCFAQSDWSVVDWMDYVTLSQETGIAFQDQGIDYPSNVTTRAFSWNDPICTKTGLNVEFECNKSMAEVTVNVIRDDMIPVYFEAFATVQTSLVLPLTLPFQLPQSGVVRKSFDLQRYDPFRELQFEVTAAGGKLSMRSIAASGWINALQIQS